MYAKAVEELLQSESPFEREWIGDLAATGCNPVQMHYFRSGPGFAPATGNLTDTVVHDQE